MHPGIFVASKVMCWVAVDRAARLAELRDDTELAERRRRVAAAMHAEICSKGVDDRGVFTQHYDTTALDAAHLLLPVMGFLPADDPRVRAMVLAVAGELTEDDLALRYRVETTTTASPARRARSRPARSGSCRSALALVGEVDRARALFEKLSFAGPVLLYAEEIDTTTGQLLGNLLQAFTHLALIDAAARLIEREQVTSS